MKLSILIALTLYSAFPLSTFAGMITIEFEGFIEYLREENTDSATYDSGACTLNSTFCNGDLFSGFITFQNDIIATGHVTQDFGGIWTSYYFDTVAFQSEVNFANNISFDIQGNTDIRVQEHNSTGVGTFWVHQLSSLSIASNQQGINDNFNIVFNGFRFQTSESFLDDVNKEIIDYSIFNYSGYNTDGFSLLFDDPAQASSYRDSIFYTRFNNVSSNLTTVSEPSTLSILGFGFIVITTLIRRKHLNKKAKTV